MLERICRLKVLSWYHVAKAADRVDSCRPFDKRGRTSVPRGDPQLCYERDLTAACADESRTQTQDRLVDRCVVPPRRVLVLRFEDREGPELAMVDPVPAEDVDRREKDVVILLIRRDKD